MRYRLKYRGIKEFLYHRIPITIWLPQYSWIKFLQDTLAGITVGLTVVPQGIAYAVVAGLPPHHGLYSSFMGCFVYLIFGSTSYVTVGPTAIMGLLTRIFVLKYGDDFAVLLTFFTGCLITTMGLLHLGFLVNFISMPVICGFTNAAAIIIGTSQINDLLGISGHNESFIKTIKTFVKNFNEIRLYDALLGTFSIIILIVLKNFPGNRLGNCLQKCMWLLCLAQNAIVVIIGMFLTYCLSLYGFKPFKFIGMVKEGLPILALPPIFTRYYNDTYNLLDIINILGSSIISAPLIAFLESIVIAKAFAKGKTVDANQEMIAVGLCNLFSSFVRSMPIAGSFTRSAINNISGVQTPMGGLITGCFVLFVCSFLTKAFNFIPKATLASVIIVAMYYMLEIRILRLLWQNKKFDLLVLLATLLSCLSFGLEIGMIIGIITNILMILYDTARPALIIEERSVDDKMILFVSPQQSLTFPSAEYIKQRVMTWSDLKKDINIIIIDGRNVNNIDSTVAKSFSSLFTDLKLRKQKLIFWNWHENICKILTAFNIIEESHFKTSSN
ncbi:PREDICTED: sodium-independent sulfate anion transporter-like, partial [Ceratosolen solmsi marchali]|uniref:Sodium-independent sulfate anion transporter-like n=1 Tax=Ceratosolen solmsi marchali TaxID=326594 RepID=A0AAJ7E0U1_9HYME